MDAGADVRGRQVHPRLRRLTGAAEFGAVPRVVLVHDPSAAGALDRLPDVPGDELAAAFLFRERPDPATFGAEHARFVDAIRAFGIEVARLGDVVRERDELAANPNHVYTRDSAITLPWLPEAFVRCSMRMPVRRREPDVLAAALGRLGLDELFAPPEGCHLEGGDVIPFELAGRRALLVGYGPRTSRRALDLLWERLAPIGLDELFGVRLPEWRLNLDGALVPVARDLVVVHPESVSDAFVRDRRGDRAVELLPALAAAGVQAIEVSREESTALQACNVLCLGEGRVVAYDLCARVAEALAAHGLEVAAVPGAELIKGTGGPRCMTRPVYA